MNTGKKEIYQIKELGFVPPKYGGISVSISRLINKLTADGFLVGGFYTSENKNDRIIHSVLFDPELNLSTKRILFSLPKFQKVLEPYRILHSHYSLEHMIYIWCFLHLLHKTIVVTVHNSMVKHFYEETDFINRCFLKLVANNSKVTWIAVSEQAKNEMLELPVIFKNEIHIIPAYIPDDDKKMSPLPSKLENYIANHDKNIVFYAHSFMSHYGRDVYGFRDALSLYKELLAVEDTSIGFILCLSDDKDKAKIETLHLKAVELGIDTQIYWQIGALSNMKSLWKGVDVYIRPTSTDGDSVAVREALDFGIQVVASDVCPRPNKTILYEFGNMADFCFKVRKALKIKRASPSPDYSNYIKIRNIYEQLLKK